MYKYFIYKIYVLLHFLLEGLVVKCLPFASILVYLFDPSLISAFPFLILSNYNSFPLKCHEI